jgi:hypothetical protein
MDYTRREVERDGEKFVVERGTLIENDDFGVDLERINGVYFIHSRLYNPSKSVLKEMKQRLEQLCFNLDELGYPTLFAMYNKADEKDIRWAKFFGFVEEADLGDYILMGKTYGHWTSSSVDFRRGSNSSVDSAAAPSN